MSVKRILRGVAAALVACVASGPAMAEQTFDFCEVGRASCVDQANRGRIGLISGSASGTYIKVADDIRRAVATGSFNEDLRVLPMVGLGSVKNIEDMLYLQNTDVGLVQADVLELFRRVNAATGRYGDVLERIRYLAPVYNEEIHVICRRGACGQFFGDVTDDVVLNLGSRNSGTALTAQIISVQLGFSEENFRFFAPRDALAFLKDPEGAGENRIDGMIYVAGKPVSLLQEIEADDGLELVELSSQPQGLEVYVPGVIEENDGYSGLLGSRAFVRTLAVPAVLAVYGGTYRHPERRKNLELFCRALVEKAPELRSEAGKRYHPKWNGWDPAKTVAGWSRHELMDEALKP